MTGIGAAGMTGPLDLVTLGESMLRLATPDGYSLENAPHLLFQVAGSESNVAVMLRRLRHPTGWISRLVNDPLGRRIARDIAAEGVDISRVIWTPTGRTGAYYIEPGRRPRATRVIYDRAGSAAAGLEPSAIDWAYLTAARVVHLTGITPALSPSCHQAVAEVLREAGAAGCVRSFDINYRARLWASPQQAATALAALLERHGIELLVATADDAATLFGLTGRPEAVASALRRRFGARMVVVTAGGRATAALDADRSAEAEGFALEPVDRVGAGDAFMAGFLHGWLEGVEVSTALRYGLAMAALKHTFYGDIAWVGPEELDTLARTPPSGPSPGAVVR